jgi:hypothetical protein
VGPGEIEEWLEFVPFTPARLTLSSGTVIELRRRADVTVNGLSLAIYDQGGNGSARLRLISIPNIAMIEPLPPAPESAQYTGVDHDG